MKHKIFALVIVSCIMITSAALAASRFRDFPSEGICTGDYVRYRSDPNTEADIMGRLFTGDQVTVVSQTSIDGELWYEIEYPGEIDTEGDSDYVPTVWVYGKYIRPR